MMRVRLRQTGETVNGHNSTLRDLTVNDRFVV